MSPTAQITIVAPTPTRSLSGSRSNHGHSRASSPSSQRQLSARRGSVSAPDPHGRRATPPPKCALSRLTLVRVPPPKEVMEAPAGRKHHSRTPGRTGSPGPASPSRLSFASASFSAPNSPTLSPRSMSPRPASPSRLSFASMSFSGPGHPQSPVPSPSPGGQHVHVRTSSASSNSSASGAGSFQRLSPSQIYDLAKVSSRPTASMAAAAAASHASPTSFLQLADDVYLPFVDRPAEVSALISSGANAKIMKLFAQSLPSSSDGYFPRSSAELAETAASWSYEDLTAWLTYTPRAEAGDEEWVRALRMFILPKSEVLWERVKSMFGIPPELDVDSPEHAQGALPKEPTLNIDQIHPVPFSPALQLDDISEAAEEGANSATTSLAEQVLGLRVSTPLAFPSSLSQTASPTPAPHIRARTPSQSSVPTRSSPLAPKPASPPRPASQTLVNSSSSSLRVPADSKSRSGKRIPSRQTACPMFPSSFDKLGLRSTLLSVR